MQVILVYQGKDYGFLGSLLRGNVGPQYSPSEMGLQGKG
jgi:hypothetical protein